MPKRKTSDVWDFFTVHSTDTKKAVCKLCKNSFSRGGKDGKTFTTSNLLRHLEVAHKKELDEYNKEKVQECPPKKQPTLAEFRERNEQYPTDHPRAQEITRKIAEMIAVDMQPFSVVEDEGFSRLVKLLDPKYRLPSEKLFRETAIPTLYKKVMTRIIELLSTAIWVNATMDIWSSQSLDAYLGITVHWIDGNFQRKAACIGVIPFSEDHTGPQIRTKVTDVLAEWKLDDKIHLILRDNASNMVAALRDSPFMDLGCVIHTLQLVVKNGLLSQRSVIDALARARKIVGHFKHSPKAVAILHDLQAQFGVPIHQLIQDVSTRWDSSYDMIGRLIEQRRPIVAALADDRKAVELLLGPHEWSLLEAVHSVLQVFKEATLLLSKKSSSVSEVIPLVNTIKNKLREPDVEHSVGTMKKELREALIRRLGDCESDMNLAVATILDPRYKGQAFDSKSAAAIAEEHIVKLVQHEIQRESTDVIAATQQSQPGPSSSGDGYQLLGLLQAFLNRPQTVRSQLEHDNDDDEGNASGIQGLAVQDDSGKNEETYLLALSLTSEYARMPRAIISSDPLDFWRCSTSTPLKALARKYLGAPASSVESERLFSTAGLVSSGTRNRLRPEQLDRLIFLQKNLKLINYEY